MRLAEAIPQYLNDPASKLRTQSSKRSRRALLHQLAVAHPSKHLGQFTETVLVEFCMRPHLAPGSQLAYRNVVKGFFAWAEYRGLVDRDPARHLSRVVSPSNTPVQHMNWLTKSQVREVLDSCGEDPRGIRDRVLLMLGFSTGLRCTEITLTRWSHIQGDQLRVFGKGEKADFVSLSDALRETLRVWASVASDVRIDHPDRPLIPRLRSMWSDGSQTAEHSQVMWDTPLQQQGVKDAVKRAGRSIGIDNLSPHDMRRTCAGILDDEGVDIRVIQRHLRHDSVLTTERYLGKKPGRTREALAGLTF